MKKKQPDLYQEETDSKLAYELKHNPEACTQKMLDALAATFNKEDSHKFCSQIRDFLEGKIVLTDIKFRSMMLNAGALMGLAVAGYLRAKEQTCQQSDTKDQ